MTAAADELIKALAAWRADCARKNAALEWQVSEKQRTGAITTAHKRAEMIGAFLYPFFLALEFGKVTQKGAAAHGEKS